MLVKIKLKKQFNSIRISFFYLKWLKKLKFVWTLSKNKKTYLQGRHVSANLNPIHTLKIIKNCQKFKNLLPENRGFLLIFGNLAFGDLSCGSNPFLLCGELYSAPKKN